MRTTVISIVALLLSAQVSSAEYAIGSVEDIGVKYGMGCAAIKKADSNITTIAMDLSTPAGSAEYSTALAAFSAGQTLTVYLTDEMYPTTICNMPNVKKHGMLFIQAQ